MQASPDVAGTEKEPPKKVDVFEYDWMDDDES